MKAKLMIVLVIIVSLAIGFQPAQAASYKLTISETYNFALYMYESTASRTVEELNSGETDCKTVLMIVSAVYGEDSLDPFVYGKRATVKNESGKTIANVQMKSTYKRVSDYECRVSTTVSIPKAKFYSFYVSGFMILDSIPFSKFKSGKASITMSDFQP